MDNTLSHISKCSRQEHNRNRLFHVSRLSNWWKSNRQQQEKP